ncbi:PREDICTED: tRNA pseudouridine synthase-like 1, partial [Rhagoletis zephyria]|uniref:tRNA pseudouridine synthase-like 1 n=1 Tax=Rhagoletis zephyria TaxID=28612 RepID=UPI0008116DCC
MGISSRTDAGVHAYQNTLNVDLTHPFPDTIYKPSFITESVNRILAMKSHEITVLETRLVPSYFHSRINAKYRSYVYRLAVASDGDDGDQSTDSETSTSSNQSTKANSLDISLVRQCTELFVGRHDFANFSSVDSNNREKDTVKTLDLLQLHQCPPPLTSFELQTEAYSRLRFYELHIKAKSFLYNQVRRM